MLQSLLLALGLVLILEGLLPLYSPRHWRSLFEQMLKLEDGQIRFFGLFMVTAGAVLVMVLA